MRTKILIVEDNSDFLVLVERSLAHADYEIFKAAGGTQALEIARKERPDIILSDIEMPNGNGIQLLKNVRAIDGGKTFIVMMSGSKHHTAKVILRFGANGFLEKPFSRHHLVASVTLPYSTFSKKLLDKNQCEPPAFTLIKI